MLTVDDILIPIVRTGNLIKIKSAHNPHIDLNCQYFVINKRGNIVTIARRIVNSAKPVAINYDSQYYTIDALRDRFLTLDINKTLPDNTCIGKNSCVRVTFSNGESCPCIVELYSLELQKASIKVGFASLMIEAYINSVEKTFDLNLNDNVKMELISLELYNAESQEPLYQEAHYKRDGVINQGLVAGWTFDINEKSLDARKIYYIVDSNDHLIGIPAKKVILQKGLQIASNEYADVDIKNAINADIMNYYSRKPSKYKYFNFEDKYDYNLSEILKMTGHSGDKIDETNSSEYDIPTDIEMLNKYSVSMFKDFCKLNNLQFTPKLFLDKFLSGLYEYIKDIVWLYLPEKQELINWCKHSYY